MVSPRDAAWAFTDVWVFAAIGTHDRRCSLAEVVAAADWINHAILLDREVDSALANLVGSGLVRVFDDWTFEVTDDGAGLLADTGRSLSDHLRAVEAWLVDVELTPAPVKLPDGALDRAVAKYLEDHR